METDAPETLEAPLADFLAALGIAAQRFALYPRRHPMVAGLSASLEAKAVGAFDRRRGLAVALTLAGRDLVVDEAVVRDRSPHIRELARRIRARNLALVEIRPGASGEELAALCGALAEEAPPGGPSLEVPRDSRNVRFHPMEFDRLILDDEEYPDGRTPSALLWLELARTAFGVEGEDPRMEDPRQVARAVANGVGDARRARELVSNLRSLVSELSETDDTPEAREINERLHTLLAELDASVLEQLLAASRNPGETELLIRDASEVLGPDTFLKLLRAAAPERGEALSPTLARALSKMALHANKGAAGVRGAVQSAVHDAISQLLGGARVEDPSPARYAAILDGLAREAERSGSGGFREQPIRAWTRTLQMAVEVGTWGPGVSDAVAGILEAGQVATLIEILERAPDASEVTEHLEKWVVRPEALLELAQLERLPEGLLDALVERMGMNAIDPLLDALALTNSRSTRRAMLAVLEGFGEPAALRALERLDDPRWYVIRNRLALARGLAGIPAGIDLEPYLRHEDHRVRIEALELVLRISDRRAPVLIQALEDMDHRVVLRALRTLATEIPGEPPPPVLSKLGHLLESSHPAEVHLLTLGALAASSSPQARDLLVGQVSRRGLFGRPRLRKASPLMQEGLRVLALRWSGDPVAKLLLRQALRSRNESIRKSALPPVPS